MPEAVRGLRRALGRLFADQDSLDRQEIVRESDSLGAAHAARCRPGDRVVLWGRNRARRAARCGRGTVSALLDDGSADIVLRWSSPRPPELLRVGAALRVSGVLEQADDGSWSLQDPELAGTSTADEGKPSPP